MDENNISQDQTQQTGTFEDTLNAQRQKWTKEIEDLNVQMQTMPKLNELLNTIFSTRQNAVEYYHAMNGVILKQSKEYKKLYNDMFNNIKINGYNGLRFTTDQSIARQVETDLQDRKEVIDLLTNQNNFIKETIATIDNMIYGVNNKIKIYEMINGLKY